MLLTEGLHQSDTKQKPITLWCKPHIPHYIEIRCRYRYWTYRHDIPLYALVCTFTNSAKTDELLQPGYIRIHGKKCTLQKQSLNEGKVTSPLYSRQGGACNTSTGALIINQGTGWTRMVRAAHHRRKKPPHPLNRRSDWSQGRSGKH